MPDNMNVYEITQMMRNRNVIQRDMTEAMSMVQSLFQEKYVDRLQNAIRTHHKQAETNPSREVKLMQAIKAFVSEEKQKSLDGMIDAYMMMETVRNMQNELHEAQFKTMSLPVGGEVASDASVHWDGVYDVDVACLANKKNQPMGIAGFFMMMSMLNAAHNE